MKYYLLFLFVGLFLGSYSQQNNIIYDELKSQNILYGQCTPEILRTGEFQTWFIPEYESYIVNNKLFEEAFVQKFDSIYVISATWCGDTKRELPRFIKIMDQDYFQGINIKYFFVDGNKKSNLIDTEALYIQFVPTFIFYFKGNELCRIVEEPVKSLEEDIMDLLLRIQD